MDKLDKPIVLVLNSAWQAIHQKSVKDAMVMLASGSATSLDISGENMTPVKWEDWITLPVREIDNFVSTKTMRIRIPTVIIAVNYSKVPKRRPRLSNRAIYDRDGGKCQYTGRQLRRGEGNVDHVIPRAKGGKTVWTNVVLADKKLNTIKADRTPQEAGLKLLRSPKAPAEMPVMATIRNPHGIPDWEHFLLHNH